MAEEPESADAQAAAPGSPVIKRRWAIVRRAGGGAALLAVAGTLALADPSDGSDPGADSAAADSHVSAEA
jgi:hypothetical protein